MFLDTIHRSCLTSQNKFGIQNALVHKIKKKTASL